MIGALNSKRGFTLVELIIVTIIVGILAAVAIPMMQGNIMKSRQSEAVSAMGTIKTAMRMYATEHGGKCFGTGFSAATSGEEFAAGTGPLSAYIKPSDLLGAYYDAAGYSVVASDPPSSGLQGYKITVVPRVGNAPKKADLSGSFRIQMDQDGVVAYID